MKGELAADKVKTAGRKRQPRTVGAHPGNVRRLAPSLAQHAERSVEADTPSVRQQRDAVGDQLISGAAADIQNGQASGGTPFGKRQQFRIRRARPKGLRVIKMRYLVVVHPREAPRMGVSQGVKTGQRLERNIRRANSRRYVGQDRGGS